MLARCKTALPGKLRDGGDEGARTLDPHVANVVLSQLSYIPICAN